MQYIFVIDKTADGTVKRDKLYGQSRAVSLDRLLQVEQLTMEDMFQAYDTSHSPMHRENSEMQWINLPYHDGRDGGIKKIEAIRDDQARGAFFDFRFVYLPFFFFLCRHEFIPSFSSTTYIHITYMCD